MASLSRANVHANVVVGLLMLTLVAQAALSLRLVRLRARMARLEGRESELFHSLTEVRGWAVQETPGGREEVLHFRGEDSAAAVRTRREKELAPDVEKVAEAEGADDDAATTVFDAALLHAELQRSSQLRGEEEEEEVERTPEGECEVTLVTAVEHGEKEGT